MVNREVRENIDAMANLGVDAVRRANERAWGGEQVSETRRSIPVYENLTELLRGSQEPLHFLQLNHRFTPVVG